MRVPDEIKDCVAFIYKVDEVTGEYSVIGTGFFVSISGKVTELNYIYFVTAKHVEIALKDSKFAIRINYKDGSSKLEIFAKGSKWYGHPLHEENPADLSITYFPYDEKSSIKTIPLTMFLDPQIIRDGRIGVGDEVFITGLFSHLSGKQKNLPIVRMGNIAMIPDEKVPTEMFGDIDAYLIEARSLGGISGSPVFVRETTIVGVGSFYLAGLIHGHWEIPKSTGDIMPQLNSINGSENVNLGIAIVTPAIKIKEIIESELFQKERDRDETQWLSDNPSVKSR